MSSPSRRSGESYASPVSPRARSPIPQFDLPRRPSSSNRYEPRRPSIASSISSIGGSLDTNVHRLSTTGEYGHNAISTLLQPPIVRTGLVPYNATSAPGFKAATTKDIPPVALTNIPHVETASFKPYLSQVGPLFEAFRHAKAEEQEGAPALIRKSSTGRDDSEGILGRPALSRSGSEIATPTVESPGGLLSPASATPPRRKISKRNAVTPLSSIPSVYLEENFHLENPRTFDIVSERAEVVRQPVIGDAPKAANGSAAPPRKALATNAILQEKLSWYMDTVEVHLISSISTASASFFTALGSLKELHSEAEESVTKIQALREDLRALDQSMALGGLEIVNLRRRQANFQKLGQAVDQVRMVIDEATVCEDMVEQGELDDALDRLDGIELLVSGHQPRWPEPIDQDLIDLRGLRALGGISEGLDQLRYRIGRGFENRFISMLLTDIRNHVKAVPPQDTLQRWNSAFTRSRNAHGRNQSVLPAYGRIDSNLRPQLLATLHGLSKSSYTATATVAFRDAMMREIKGLIRQHLPSSDDDDAESMASASTRSGRKLSQQDKSAILARNLRALEPEDAEDLLVKVYTGVGEAVRRLGVLVKVLLDVTSGVLSPPNSSGIKSPPKSPSMQSMNSYLDPSARSLPQPNPLQDDLTQILDLSSLLGQAIESAQIQVNKILKVRSEQTARLPVDRFLRYFNINRLFAEECEAITGQPSSALKSLVNQQIVEFVHVFSESEKANLVESMDNDKWDARDFTDTDNDILSRILQGMTSDPQAWSRGHNIWEKLEAEPNAKPPSINGDANGAGKEKVRTASIDEEKFVVVESVITAMKGIDRFENLIAGIPGMTPEISLALIDYLKLFNSRSSQLILGAGATRSAGLKNITTKHLALASQALSFVIALVPYVRECARRHAGASSGILTKFDELKRLYQEHQSGIHDKLIEIMSGRATSHVSAMKKVDWDSAPVIEQQTSPFMETLVKETNTMHRNLSKHLPEMTVRMIMYPIFANYKDQWGKAFSEAVVTTDNGKARLLRDVELFDSKLNKLDGAGDVGKYIISIVKDKAVKVQQKPAQPSEAVMNGDKKLPESQPTEATKEDVKA